MVGVDVDAVLGHPGVHATVRHRAQRGPPDHDLVVGGDEAVVGEVAGVPALPARRLGLEGGVAGGDPGLVDVPHRRPVLVAHRADRRRRLGRADDGVGQPGADRIGQRDLDVTEPGAAQRVLVGGRGDGAGGAGHAGRCAVVGPGADDVADPDTTARAQHPGDLGERGVLVARQHDDAVRDDDVDRRILERDLLDRAVQELDVGRPGLGGVAARQLEHLDGGIEPVGEPARADPAGRQQHVDPAARAEVQHDLARMEIGHGDRVAAPEADRARAASGSPSRSS